MKFQLMLFGWFEILANCAKQQNCDVILLYGSSILFFVFSSFFLLFLSVTLLTVNTLCIDLNVLYVFIRQSERKSTFYATDLSSNAAT